MSLTTTMPSSSFPTIPFVVRGLAGVLVDTSRVKSSDKVRVCVRVLHNGVLQGESPYSHPLRPIGDAIYSLQRHVASWSQRHEKPIRLEAPTTGEVLRLEICLKLQNGERWVIGSGEWVTNMSVIVSDVEIVCALSEDMKESSPYRVDPRGDAVLRVAVMSPEAKTGRQSPLQDPPGFESKSGPIEPSSESTLLESPVKASLEQSASRVKGKETSSPKKRVSFSPTKLETRYIIPANKKTLTFFPAIFGGSKDGKRKLKKNVRGRNSITKTASPRTRATAKTISVAPVINPPNTQQMNEIKVHLVGSNMNGISSVSHGSPLRKDKTYIWSEKPPHTPVQQSPRPATVSPDPPERSVRLLESSKDMSSSSIEEGAEYTTILDAPHSPDSSGTYETEDSELETEQPLFMVTESAMIVQETALEVNNADSTKSGMELDQNRIPDEATRILVPSLAQTDQIDQDSVGRERQEGPSLTHYIPETFDLACIEKESNPFLSTAVSNRVAVIRKCDLVPPFQSHTDQTDPEVSAAALQEACSLTHCIPETHDISYEKDTSSAFIPCTPIEECGDSQLSHDHHQTNQATDVRWNSPVGFEMERLPQLVETTAPAMSEDENTRSKSRNSTASKTPVAVVSSPEITPESPKCMLVACPSQTDQIDEESTATTLHSECSLNHCIPGASGLPYKMEIVDNECIPSKRQSAPDQVALVWDSKSPGSSAEACDDSEVTLESHTKADDDFRHLFSFDPTKASGEERGHHSWSSAKDDDQSFFTTTSGISGH